MYFENGLTNNSKSGTEYGNWCFRIVKDTGI